MRHKLMNWSLAGVLLLASLPATAKTVAYWRFEDGQPDAQVQHLAGTNGVWSPDIIDVSGNGNHLSAWSTEGWAGEAYKTDVAFPTVPNTGAANLYSIKNTGGYPGLWCPTLANWEPSQFTIEATFKPETGGWRTLVGRDSKGYGTQPGADPNASALYFQIQPDNRVAITYQDVMGFQHTARSAPGLIQGFQWSSDPDGLTGRWYSMAGTCDGKLLSLYLNDIAAGTGYQLVAQTDLTLSGSTNTAMTKGIGSGSDWTAGSFSVMRGMYNGGHTDRAYGFIDEVRLSDTAHNDFLGSTVPEPGTLSLLALSGVALLRRRRTR